MSDFTTVGRNRRIDMIGTITEIVDMCALRREFFLHMTMQRDDVLFFIKALGDAGLIGDDENEIAAIVQLSNDADGAVNPMKTINRADMVEINVKYPVTVEKDRGPA